MYKHIIINGHINKTTINNNLKRGYRLISKSDLEEELATARPGTKIAIKVG